MEYYVGSIGMLVHEFVGRGCGPSEGRFEKLTLPISEMCNGGL